MKRPARVAVIGAGVAGAACARFLSCSEIPVTVFDPAIPREKVCGGGLSWHVIAEFPFLQELNLPFRRIRSLHIQSFPDYRAELRLQHPLLVISRNLLDNAILKSGNPKYLSVLKTRVRKVEKAARGWVVLTDAGETECDYLILADGAAGRLSRDYTGCHRERRFLRCLVVYLPMPEVDTAHLVFYRGLIGYLWCFPRVGSVSVGIGAATQVSTRAELVRHLRAFIRYDLGSSAADDHLTVRSAVIPMYPPPAWDQACSGDGWALVGDCAGFANPLTGEGIHLALRSASLLCRCLMDGHPESYGRACRQAFGDDMKHTAALTPRFYRGTFINGMIRAIRSSPRIAGIADRMVAGDLRYRDAKRQLVNAMPAGMWEMVKNGRYRDLLAVLNEVAKALC